MDFLYTNLLQRDDFIFLPEDEQCRTLQLIPVFSFADNPCTLQHDPHVYYFQISAGLHPEPVVTEWRVSEQLTLCIFNKDC